MYTYYTLLKVYLLEKLIIRAVKITGLIYLVYLIDNYN